jgi:hypothetical protein
MTSGGPSLILADGVFDLEELKKDISAADAKFAGRKYKPTALILEYLIARASKQNVPVPSFVSEKSPSATKKRVSEGNIKRPMKRFSAKKQRPVYHTEHESWEDDEDHQQLEEDWEEDQAEGDDSLLAGTLLHRKAPFLIAPPNFARTGILPTRTQRRDATNCTRLKEKEHQAKDRAPFFSPKALRTKEKGMERSKESLAKAKVYGKVRVARGSNLKAWEGR